MRFLSLTILAGALASGQSLSPAWVELGEGGAAIARIVVNIAEECPTARIDGHSLPMPARQPVPDGLRPVCEIAIPRGARSAAISGQALKLPKPNPAKIVTIGDTGCRIKDERLQNCHDPATWPFEQVAARAAAETPDLVIHVGDYLYRETPCPAALIPTCGGPSGDNWAAWNADFFTPAAKLLAAAPWAFSRGNHETCARSWRGWFYYLDPRPWTDTCQSFTNPYKIRLGTFELVMFDTSALAEDSMEEGQIAIYASKLASVHPETKNAWLAAHHPFWGFKTNTAGDPPVPVSAPLEEAWNRASPQGISLILSGHVHLFELVRFDHGRPSQLVAGDGGTDMALPLSNSTDGRRVGDATVLTSESQQQFGYTVLAKSSAGWNLTLKNRLGEVLFKCVMPR